MNTPQRILFVRTDRLGETLLTLPVIAGLKAALPRATITCLVDSSLSPLVARATGVDAVMASEHSPRSWFRRAVRLAGRLRPNQFDAAIVSNPMKELHLAVWLSGIPRRIGYDHKWSWMLTHPVPDRKALGEQHEVEHHLRLVRELGVPVSVPPSWGFPPFPREQEDVLQMLEREGVGRREPLIVVHPWASMAVKQWPAERYQCLIEWTMKAWPVRVVVIGGAESAGRMQEVRSTNRSVVSLAGRLTLVQLAALLQRAQLLVSGDSGPVHLAAAVQTKTVVLFGTTQAATGPRRWGPWGSAGHTVIWKPSMDAITGEEVFDALAHQLDPARASRPDAASSPLRA